MLKTIKRYYIAALFSIFCLLTAALPAVHASYDCTVETRYYFTPYEDGLAPYLSLLDQAKQSVYIAIYSYTEPAITDKLIELHNRGIQVHMIMDRSQSHGKAESLEIEKLQNAGIDLLTGTSVVHGQIMHDKLTIVDNRFVEFGSWNYTTSATKQDNVFMISESPELATQFMRYWQRMKNDILNWQRIDN